MTDAELQDRSKCVAATFERLRQQHTELQKRHGVLQAGPFDAPEHRQHKRDLQRHIEQIRELRRNSAHR
jgi:hypothetical protein